MAQAVCSCPGKGFFRMAVESISKCPQSCTHSVLSVGLPLSPGPQPLTGARCLSIASSLPRGLLNTPTCLQLAKNVEVLETGIAARFVQKGKWVEERELLACCCLKRRHWWAHLVLKRPWRSLAGCQGKVTRLSKFLSFWHYQALLSQPALQQRACNSWGAGLVVWGLFTQSHAVCCAPKSGATAGGLLTLLRAMGQERVLPCFAGS